MKHQHILPPAHLSAYVRYFWTLESDGDESPPKMFRTIADGCPGLIFQQSDYGTFFQHDKKLSPLFLYGQTTKYTEIVSPTAFRTIGIYFHPHALSSVFALPAEALTNTCIDMEPQAFLNGDSLTQLLLNEGNVNNMADLLCSYLHQEVSRNKIRNCAASQYALSELIRTGGNTSLRLIQEQLALSERSLERKFKQNIGISPKLFSRICRFQASLSQLRSREFGKLSDIAFENEYADQSHFIRSFKEFAGCSPFHYQRQANELVENFPEMIGR